MLLPVPAAAATPEAPARAGFGGRHQFLGEDGAIETMLMREGEDRFVAVGAEFAGLVPPIVIDVMGMAHRESQAPTRATARGAGAVDLLLPVEICRFLVAPSEPGALRCTGGGRSAGFAAWALRVDAVR